MMEANKISQYLNAKEAAEYLGVSPSTFDKWIRKEKLDIIRYEHPVTGRPIYLEKDLERFLQSIKRGVI